MDKYYVIDSVFEVGTTIKEYTEAQLIELLKEPFDGDFLASLSSEDSSNIFLPGVPLGFERCIETHTSDRVALHGIDNPWKTESPRRRIIIKGVLEFPRKLWNQANG